MRERGLKSVVDWIKGPGGTEVRKNGDPQIRTDGLTGNQPSAPPEVRNAGETVRRMTVKTTLVLPLEIYKALKVRAAEVGAPMAGLATDALAGYLGLQRPVEAKEPAA